MGMTDCERREAALAQSLASACTHSRVTTVPVARKYAEVEKRLQEALNALRPLVVCDECSKTMTREEWHDRAK